jgi:hypothetical protein
MVEYYVKGQTYTPGTILKWKNGTKVQIQQNGGHKIVSTKKIISKHKNSIVNDTQEGGEFMITKIINHVKGTKYAPGTFVKLSNDMVALVQQNGGYKFLYNARTRARKSKRKQFRRLQDKQKKKHTQTAIISGGAKMAAEAAESEEAKAAATEATEATEEAEAAATAAEAAATAAEAAATAAEAATATAATEEAEAAAAAKSTEQQTNILDKLKEVNVNLNTAKADLTLSAEKTDKVLNNINNTANKILTKMGPLVAQVEKNKTSISELGDMSKSRTSPGAELPEGEAKVKEEAGGNATPKKAELPIGEEGAQPEELLIEEKVEEEETEETEEEEEAGGDGAPPDKVVGDDSSSSSAAGNSASVGAKSHDSSSNGDADTRVDGDTSTDDSAADKSAPGAEKPADVIEGGYLSGGAIQSKKQIYNLFRTPHKIKDNGELEVINKHTHKMKHLKPMLFFKTSKHTIQLGFIMVELLKCEVNTDLSEYLLIKPLTLNIDNVDPPIKACNKKCTVDNTKQLQKYIRDVFNKKQFKQIFDDPNKNLLIMYILDHKMNIELQLVILNSQTNTLTTFDEYMECSSHAKADSSLLKDSIISKWFGK